MLGCVMTVSLHAPFLCALFAGASIALRKSRRTMASARSHTQHTHKCTHPHGRKALNASNIVVVVVRLHLRRTNTQHTRNTHTLFVCVRVCVVCLCNNVCVLRVCVVCLCVFSGGERPRRHLQRTQHTATRRIKLKHTAAHYTTQEKRKTLGAGRE